MKHLAVIISLVLLASCDQPTVVSKATPSPTPEKAVVKPTPTPEPPIMGRVSESAAPKRFNLAQIRPEWTARLDVIVAGIVRNRDRYTAIEKMRTGGVPWYFVGGIHERESSRNFSRHLHEGGPLLYRTRDVPKNRLPSPKNPPYSFEQSAEDALYVLKREDKVPWNDTKMSLDALEAYNGLGYRNYHPDVASPYLWSGTTKYLRGKYISDGRFSSTAVDKQAGIAALWGRMIDRGILP